MTAETETRLGLAIISFDDGDAFEHWMEAQSSDAPGVWLKIAKKGRGAGGIAKAEAIDRALCQGWIDGQQHPYDDHYWLTRFTPRRPKSRWSQVNRTRALELIDAGRMRSAGLAEVEKARSDGRWSEAYAPASSAEEPAELREALDASERARATLASLPRSSIYAIIYRLTSVKGAATKARKVGAYVEALERGIDPITGKVGASSTRAVRTGG